jgi:hypothetical protein
VRDVWDGAVAISFEKGFDVGFDLSPMVGSTQRDALVALRTIARTDNIDSDSSPLGTSDSNAG